MVPGLGVSAYLVMFAAAGLVDPPGFGGSGEPAHRLGVPEIAEVFIDWLRRKDFRRVMLIGHSCGTQVAARVAADAPDSVERLVLGSPTVDPRYRSWPKAVLRWRRDRRLEPRSLVRTQWPEWRRAGP